ncbi:MAG: radical SAM protein [Deltaproteobacteria bacterium]|nr:radical SAM protein [Deltaproteobacteria bacterium]
MRLVDTIVKSSMGRLALHHLCTSYSVEVNRITLAALEDGLAGDPGRGAALLERLQTRGLVDPGVFAPVPQRTASDVVSIELEPISQCNLRCRHCYVRTSGDTMTEATFAAVLEGAARLGAVELAFNGGEPLLHEHCLDWIERARQAELRVVLFSNATRIDAASAERLAAARVAKVVVSLDGFQHEHDALRGKGAFEQAERGLRHLTRAGVAVWITTLVHPANYTSVDALTRHAIGSLGVHGVRRTMVMPLGRAADRPELAVDDAEFRRLYEGTVECGVGRGAPMLPCAAGVDKLFVRADGEVHACRLFAQAAPALGSLAQASLQEIYRGPRARGWPYRGFLRSELDECAGCSHLERCAGGCRARAWLVSGNPRGRDPSACRRLRAACPTRP